MAGLTNDKRRLIHNLRVKKHGVWEKIIGLYENIFKWRS